MQRLPSARTHCQGRGENGDGALTPGPSPRGRGENGDGALTPGPSPAGRGENGDGCPHPRPLSQGERGERQRHPHPRPLSQGERGERQRPTADEMAAGSPQRGTPPIKAAAQVRKLLIHNPARRVSAKVPKRDARNK